MKLGGSARMLEFKIYLDSRMIQASNVNNHTS